MLKTETTERTNEAPQNSYNEISKFKKQSYAKGRSNSDPTYNKHATMFYITLIASSPEITSTAETNINSPDTKRKGVSSNKNDNAKNKNVEGLFQCQELDGGNAIECKFICFQC